MSSLRMAIINDIHNGPDRGTKKGSMALPLLDAFQSWLELEKPDIVIDLGDRISDVDHDTDIKLMQAVSDKFKKMPFKKVHLLGNHDVAELSIEENESIMDTSFRSHSVNIKGITLVFWNAHVRLNQQKGFSLPDEDIEWLQSELEKSSYPTIIFTHAPLDNGSMVGNFYFDKAYPHHAHYPKETAEKVRDIIERSNKVIMCINGHAHWSTYHCVDGIHYVTLPSLTETFVTYPDAHEAWTMITFTNEIKVVSFGKAPIALTLIPKGKNHHWPNIHKDYAPSGEKPQ